MRDWVIISGVSFGLGLATGYCLIPKKAEYNVEVRVTASKEKLLPGARWKAELKPYALAFSFDSKDPIKSCTADCIVFKGPAAMLSALTERHHAISK